LVDGAGEAVEVLVRELLFTEVVLLERTGVALDEVELRLLVDVAERV